MNLTGDRFRKLLQSLEEATAAAPPKPNEQRKATRVGVRMALEMQELDGDRLLPPKRIFTRDMSSTGMGFNYSKALDVGRRIVFAFPSSFGEAPLDVLYEVKYRRILGPELFGIGAVLVEVGYTPPAQPAARSAPAAAGARPAQATKAAPGKAPAPAPAAAVRPAVATATASKTAAAAAPAPAPHSAAAPEPAQAATATAEDREALAQRIRSAMFEDN